MGSVIAVATSDGYRSSRRRGRGVNRYTALGQPTSIASATQTYASAIAYWPNGALKQFTYGNGIVHSLTQNARQLPLRSQDLDGSAPVHDDTYTYDANGNVAAIADSVPGNHGNRSMTYDALDRLTDVSSPMYGAIGAHYSYNVLDNLTGVTAPSTGGSLKAYCYDEGASWQLTNVKAGSCGGVSEIGLGYDVQGNLANRNGILYGFDYGNRLRGANAERYRYDAWGRRVRTDNALGTGLIYSLYGQDGTLYWTRDERTGRRMQYVYLGGSLIAQRMRPIGVTAETVTWQHTDALGSPVAVTSASRTVLQTSEYEPYGYLLNRPLEDGPGFTGHVMDAATGLIYMQQRYMGVGIPRFLSADPVTAYQQPFTNFNPYAYANNNPYRFTDPDGRQSVNCGNGSTIPCAPDPTSPPPEPKERTLSEKIWSEIHRAADEIFDKVLPALPDGPAIAAVPGAIAKMPVVARFNPTRIHIFRAAEGHVSPGTLASQMRFAQLFEKIASNPANLRTDAVEARIITQEAADAGVRAFTVMTRSGQQI